jgi:hypothetical protein
LPFAASLTLGVPIKPAWVANMAAVSLSDAAGVESEMMNQAALLRDMFGLLPFRPVTIDPAWLRWNWGTVPAIARRVYDERAFYDLPILADALTDAGCDNQEMIDHCRSEGPHVRGCWVLDLLLGKQ